MPLLRVLTLFYSVSSSPRCCSILRAVFAQTGRAERSHNARRACLEHWHSHCGAARFRGLESLAFPPALGSAATLVPSPPAKSYELAVDDSVKAALDRSYLFYLIIHVPDPRLQPSFPSDLVDSEVPCAGSPKSRFSPPRLPHLLVFYPIRRSSRLRCRSKST